MHSTSVRIAVDAAIALFGAALFAGYALDPRLAFLPYLCLVPWGWLYSHPERPRASVVPYVLASWVAWVLLYKQSFRYGWFAPPVMALTCLPAWWLFPFLLRRAQRWSLPRSLTLPVVWVAIEWLRTETALGHFDLFALGYSQARFPWIVQVADLTGVYGISFLLAAINGLILDVMFAARDAGWKPAAAFRNRRVVACAASVAIGWAVTGAYGFMRLATARNEEGPRLAVIQPNVAHTLKNFLGTTLRELYQTDDGVGPGEADLIVWPENAILDDFARNPFYRRDLAWLASRKGAWILLGSQGRSKTRWGLTTNTALLVDTAGTVRGSYHKQILFPWSEYIPFDDALDLIAHDLRRFQRNLVRASWGYVSTGSPGDRMTLFDLPWKGGGLPFAVLICVENSYPPLVAEAGRMGARFFVNITSEGEVAGVIQEQLLRICMLRAIENRVAYVRCGNSGISGFIDPQGRLYSVLRGKQGATVSIAGQLNDRVALSSGGATPYAASRDAFALACVLGAAALAFGVRRKTAASAAMLVVGIAGLSGCEGSRAEFKEACPTEAACREALDRDLQHATDEHHHHRGVDFYDRVIAAYPALAPEARLFRARAFERVGEFAEAAAEYEALAREHPTGRTWALLGALRAKAGDAKAAVDAFYEAQRLDPDDHRVAYLLARSHWELGDIARARESATRALELEADDARSLSLLAKIQLEAGHEEDAKQTFARVAKADEENFESRYHLSRLAWRSGDRAEALRWLAELQRLEAPERKPRRR